MKNINYVINGVLAVAVVILFVMQFSNKKESGAAKSVASEDTVASGLLPVAYINLDSLLQNYNYYKDLSDVVLRKQENSRASVMEKARALEAEMKTFQRNVENNAFLSTERAQQEQQRLMKKQQELQEYDNKLAQDLGAEQMKMNEQLRDTIVSQLQIFNQEKGYQIIFSNMAGDNILWANKSYDITNAVIEFLNKRYGPATTAVTK